MKAIKIEKLNSDYISAMDKRQTMDRNLSKAWSMLDPSKCWKVKSNREELGIIWEWKKGCNFRSKIQESFLWQACCLTTDLKEMKEWVTWVPEEEELAEQNQCKGPGAGACLHAWRQVSQCSQSRLNNGERVLERKTPGHVEIQKLVWDFSFFSEWDGNPCRSWAEWWGLTSQAEWSGSSREQGMVWRPLQ